MGITTLRHNYSNYRGLQSKIDELPHDFWSDVTGGRAHTGSWFGLPDFSLTEKVGTATNSPTTSSGGSNLFGMPASDQQYQNIQNQINAIQPKTPINPAPTNNPYNGGTGGSVLGASTVAGQPTVNLEQQAQQGVSDQSAKIRNDLNTHFDAIFGELDKQAGFLPGWEKEDLGRIGSTVSNLRSGVQTGYDNANKQIELTRGQIQGGVDSSVREIQNNLRSLLKNAQGQIGALGAGSSSVAQQYLPYAFSKMFAQERGNIQGQANSQFVDLNKKALDVETTFTQQRGQIDQWENDKMTETRDKYRGMLTDISNAKINATGQRAQALQALEYNLLSQAQNQLERIRNEASSYRQSIQEWALQRGQQLQGMQQQLAQAGQYTPTDITYNPLQGLGGFTGNNASTFFNPAFAQKRDDEENQV